MKPGTAWDYVVYDAAEPGSVQSYHSMEGAAKAMQEAVAVYAMLGKAASLRVETRVLYVKGQSDGTQI